MKNLTLHSPKQAGLVHIHKTMSTEKGKVTDVVSLALWFCEVESLFEAPALHFRAMLRFHVILRHPWLNLLTLVVAVAVGCQFGYGNSVII